MDLHAYVVWAKTRSNSSQDSLSALERNRLSNSLVSHEYDIQYSPRASVDNEEGVVTRSVGLGFDKQTIYGPNLSLGIDSQWLDQSENKNRMVSSFTVSQGLLRKWGSKYAQLPLIQANLDTELTQISVRQQEQQTVLNAIERYFSLLRTQASLEIASQTLDIAKETSAMANSRSRVGLVPKSDVYRAEIAELEAKESLRNARSALRSSRASFHLFINEPDTQRFSVRETYLSGIPSEDSVERFENILSERLDWMVIEKQIERLELDLFRAQRETLPDLQLEFGVTEIKQGDSFSELDSDNSWFIGLSLSSDFDGFVSSAKLSQARIDMRDLMREKDTLRRELESEFEELIDAIDSEGRAIDIAELKLEQSVKAFELAKIRFEQGRANNLDLIESQKSVSDSKLTLMSRRTFLSVLLARLQEFKGKLDEEWVLESQGSSS